MEHARVPSLRSEVAETFTLAWPLVGAQLFSMSMVFVDNAVVARLGAPSLAAMAMATTLYMLLNVACIGLLSPISSLVSQAMGSEQPRRVGAIARTGVGLAFFLSLAIVAVFLVSEHVLLLLRQDPALVPQARRFLLFVAPGVPASLVYLTLRQVAEGSGDTRPSGMIAAVAACLNAFLDLGLVFGWFGFPRLGLIGAGVATSISSWVMVTLMALYLRMSPRYEPCSLWKDQGGGTDGLREILRVGLPSCGSLVSEVAFFGASTFVMGTLGVQALASHQIAMNAASFTFMIPLGMSFAASIRVGRAMGRGDDAAVRRAGQAALVLAAITQTLTGSLFLLFPEAIARIYTDQPALLDLATSLLRIAGLFQWFDGIQVLSMGMLRGRLDTHLPFLATLVAYWLVGMPCALSLAFRSHLGPAGLWYGMVAGLGAAALLLQVRFWRLARAYD